MKFCLIVLISLSLFFFSCSPSLVYSPTLNLPSKPLEKHETRVNGGFEMLQETQPQGAHNVIAPGLTGSVAYGFTHSFALQLKGWTSLQNVEENQFRFGFSASGMFMLNDSTNAFRYALLPCFAMTFDNNNLGWGKGIGSWLAVWFPSKSDIKPYFAVGAGLGWDDFDYPYNSYGWGIFLNPGISVLSGKFVEVNFELAGALVFNRYENINYFILSPSVALSARF
jgi:hypothetical protein